MDRNRIDMEIILISTYCDGILEILKTHKNLSVNKTLVFAYLLKKRKFLNKDIHSALHNNDILLKCLSQLSGLFSDYCANLEFLITAMHLLIINKNLALNSTELVYEDKGGVTEIPKTFFHKAILDSKKYSDNQFLKEVIKNV